MADESVRLHACDGLAQISLRGDPTDAGFIENVAAALDLELPLTANTVSRGADRHILWLGPDEWLVVCDQRDAGRLNAVLPEKLAGRHVSIVDVSAARIILELAGPRARDVLEKGCPIDLHPRVFTPGQCAGTMIAHAQLYLEQVDDRPCYRLYLRPSFARHLISWLDDAMAEYKRQS